MNYLRLDLKICEGCGALWLRAGARDGVYCRACSHYLVDFPAPRAKHQGGRPRLPGQASTRSAKRRCTGAAQ
jgi:hypothetical protein